MSNFNTVGAYSGNAVPFSLPEEIDILKRPAETPLDILAELANYSSLKRSKTFDPYALCIPFIQQLAQYGDKIGDFFYEDCRSIIPNLAVDEEIDINCDHLKALFSKEEINEVHSILEWYVLLNYGEVFEENEVSGELWNVKKFLGILSLTDVLIFPSYSESHAYFHKRFDAFLEKLASSPSGILHSTLLGLVRENVVRHSEINTFLPSIRRNFKVCESTIAQCGEFLCDAPFQFRARFALLIGILNNLIVTEEQAGNALLEFDGAIPYLCYPLCILFAEIRKFAFTCSVESDFEQLNSHTFAGFPKYAKLNLPGHPNWMPNGGNTCYISSTLWPLFLLLNTQIQNKIEEFQFVANDKETRKLMAPEMIKAREAFVSLYQNIAKESVSDIEIKDVNDLRKTLQQVLPDQFIPNTYSPEDACDFLIWVMNDLLEFCPRSTKDPKFCVLHTFLRTSEEPLVEEAHYNYLEALAPSYSNQHSYILDLRLDEGTVHKNQLFELVTNSRNTEIIERNAYNKGIFEGPKYQSFPTHHHENILVESKESAPAFFVGRVARFTLDLEEGVKKKRFDQICPNATLEFKIKGSEEEGVTVPYDLVAMTVHSGKTINNGHYYCYFRKETDSGWKFYKYDDIAGPSVCEREKEVMEDALVNGYLFYYRKREEGVLPPPNFLLEEFFNENPQEGRTDSATRGSGRSLASDEAPLDAIVLFPSDTCVGEAEAEASDVALEAKHWVAKNLQTEFFIERTNSFYSTLLDFLRHSFGETHLQSEGTEGISRLAEALKRPIYILDPVKDQDLFVIESQLPIPGEAFRFGEYFTGEILFLFAQTTGSYVVVKKTVDLKKDIL